MTGRFARTIVGTLLATHHLGKRLRRPRRSATPERLTVARVLVVRKWSLRTFSEFEFDLNQIDLNQMIKNRFKISVHFEMIIWGFGDFVNYFLGNLAN